MQRKQNVTNRRYFVRKSSLTPDSASSHGGFKNLSRLSGSWRLLNRAALWITCFTSLTRPLHRSHRGLSGTTNLLNRKIENRTSRHRMAHKFLRIFEQTLAFMCDNFKNVFGEFGNETSVFANFLTLTR